MYNLLYINIIHLQFYKHISCHILNHPKELVQHMVFNIILDMSFLNYNVYLLFNYNFKRISILLHLMNKHIYISLVKYIKLYIFLFNHLNTNYNYYHKYHYLSMQHNHFHNHIFQHSYYLKHINIMFNYKMKRIKFYQQLYNCINMEINMIQYNSIHFINYNKHISHHISDQFNLQHINYHKMINNKHNLKYMINHIILVIDIWLFIQFYRMMYNVFLHLNLKQLKHLVINNHQHISLISQLLYIYMINHNISLFLVLHNRLCNY